MSFGAALGAVGDVAASRHGAVTRRQAAQQGLDRRHIAGLLRDGVLTEPVAGVLVATASPDTWLRRMHVAVLAGGQSAVVSGRSAARLHGIDGFDGDDLEITVRKGRRVVEGAAHRVRQQRDYPAHPDVVEILGLPCTGLARTVCDLAADENNHQVERAIDDFQRRGCSLVWLEHTAQRLQVTGRKGPSFVLHEVERRRAAGRVRGSWFEQLVELCLASPRIPGLQREYVVLDSAGGFVARVDLAVPLVRLGIEGHSRAHHITPEERAYDERRDNRAAEAGWDIRYVGFADVTQSPVQVRAYIERLVGRRARDLGIRLPTDA